MRHRLPYELEREIGQWKYHAQELDSAIVLKYAGSVENEWRFHPVYWCEDGVLGFQRDNPVRRHLEGDRGDGTRQVHITRGKRLWLAAYHHSVYEVYDEWRCNKLMKPAQMRQVILATLWDIAMMRAKIRRGNGQHEQAAVFEMECEVIWQQLTPKNRATARHMRHLAEKSNTGRASA
jgi:hypothetical protein